MLRYVKTLKVFRKILLGIVFIIKNDNMMGTKENITIEELLIRYYDGTVTPEDTDKVKAWLDASAENRETAKQFCSLLFASDTLQVLTSIDTEKALKKVHRHIAIRRLIHSGLKWSQRAAAVLFLPLLCVAFFLYHQNQSAELTKMVEVRTTPGMVTSFRLPDSTLVYLNANSTFRYPSRFNGDAREVYLNGEAYFEVTKDVKHHFIVSTSQKSSVEVFGTHFNLEAFSDKNEVIATLTEGCIKFDYEKTGQITEIWMKPGEKIIYDTKKESVKQYKTNGLTELSWKEGKIILDNTPFNQTLHLLEKRYNVEFTVKNTRFRHYSFTGTFTGQPIEQILEYFKISSNINWKYTNRQDSIQTKTQIELY